MLYGISLGGALALEAAARGPPVTKLAVWEPPYYLDDEPRRPQPTTTTSLSPRSPPTKPSSAVLVPPLQLRRARRDDLDAM
jgi:pimeloyl-ACP methyl ester carboxylesterase